MCEVHYGVYACACIYASFACGLCIYMYTCVYLTPHVGHAAVYMACITYINMYRYIYVNIFKYHTYVYIFMYAYIYIYIYKYIYIYIYIYILYVYIYICIYLYVYIHIYASTL